MSYKSSKQRRKEIKARRMARAKANATKPTDQRTVVPEYAIAVNVAELAPNNSYSVPFFYVDRIFTCRDCGKEELWTAKQQRWWYEVAKGNINSTAVRCRDCRKLERERKAEARRVHQQGLIRKAAQKLEEQND